MAPVVVFVLALLAPAFGFPFLTPEYTPEIQIQQETPLTNTAPQTGFVQEKTGAPAPTGCSAGYSQQVSFNQESVPHPVSRLQDVPVNVEQAPVAHTEKPLFLPPQPVVPVSQPQQVVRPVIVPAEVIASGRVIIMAVEPIKQRAFPDVIIVPQQQQQQQIVTETYIPIQQIQAVEKQTPNQENYTPIQQNTEQYNPQQTVQQNYNEVQQKQEQYQQVPTPEKQAYQIQNPQQQVYSTQQAVPVQVQAVQEQVVQQVENVQKQGQSGAEYTPITQTVGIVQQVQGVQPTLRVETSETVHQEQNVQQSVEPHQQVEPQQQVYSVQSIAEYVQQQQQQQTQSLTGQTEPQQRMYVQEATQPKVQQSKVVVEHQQQTYSVQPEQVQQQYQSVEPQQIQQVPENIHVPETKTGNQQVGTYESAQSYNFGDRIQQQHQAQNVVPQQQHFVQPVVVENQQ